MLDLTNKENPPNGITFYNDGTKLFVVGSDDIVLEYSLTTAFDISTATHAGNSEELPFSNLEITLKEFYSTATGRNYLF